MKCIIENPNLKTWSRVIHALTSVGGENLTFDFTDSTLTLAVIDATETVSATCTFFSTFFRTFDVPRGYCTSFKVSSKCILKPVRSLKFLTKCCTFCEIAFEKGKNSIIVTMGCKTMAEIRYTITMSEGEGFNNPDCDPDMLDSCIRTEPKLMMGSLNNFAHSKGLVDLTLQARGNKILMKNCATDLMRKEGKIYTELCLSALEFDRLNIHEDTEVTFQLKDFKTFIAFAEHMKLSMAIHFQGARDPIVVSVKSDVMEAKLMLATKYVDDPDTQNSTQSTAMSNGISNASSSQISRNSEIVQRSIEPPIPPHPDNNSSFAEASIVDMLPAHAERESSTNVRNESGPSSHKKQKNKTNRDIRDVVELENQPPRKRLRDLFDLTEPYDIYKKFPGHDIVLVEASDDDDE